MDSKVKLSKQNYKIQCITYTITNIHTCPSDGNIREVFLHFVLSVVPPAIQIDIHVSSTAGSGLSAKKSSVSTSLTTHIRRGEHCLSFRMGQFKQNYN